MKPIFISFATIIFTPFAYAQPELTIKNSVHNTSKKCSGYDLFEAVKLKQKSCVKKSLGSMDIDERNEEGETPLHVAIRLRAYALIPLLIKNGADLHKQNYRYQTPQELAQELGEQSVADLLEKIDLETDRLWQAIEYNDIQAASAALHRGASLGTRDVRLDTPLHRAAQSGFTQLAQLLIKNRASVKNRNYLGETPLHCAAMRGFTPLIILLLENGADSNALDERRQSPLDLIAGSQDPQLSALLVKKYQAQPGTAAQVSMGVSGGDGQNTDYFQGVSTYK